MTSPQPLERPALACMTCLASPTGASPRRSSRLRSDVPPGHGTIVVDGSLAGYGLLRQPLRIDLHRGRIVNADAKPPIGC
jgi:hypothetical protein